MHAKLVKEELNGKGYIFRYGGAGTNMPDTGGLIL